jgi:cold shock protein
MEGTVLWYNHRKGFGFILSGTEQVYLHHTQLKRQKIKNGDNVVFDAVKGEKGLKAINVKIKDTEVG